MANVSQVQTKAVSPMDCTPTLTIEHVITVEMQATITLINGRHNATKMAVPCSNMSYPCLSPSL